jgi:hypothetical protein
MLLTWNPSDKSTSVTVDSQSATFDNDAAGWIRSADVRTSGKWYFEVQLNTLTDGAGVYFGISELTGEPPGTAKNSYCDGLGGAHSTFGVTPLSNPSAARTITSGDTLAVAMDLDNGKIWFRYNGDWHLGGDPAAGTGETFSNISGSVVPFFASDSQTTGATVTMFYNYRSWSLPYGDYQFDMLSRTIWDPYYGKSSSVNIDSATGLIATATTDDDASGYSSWNLPDRKDQLHQDKLYWEVKVLATVSGGFIVGLIDGSSNTFDAPFNNTMGFGGDGNFHNTDDSTRVRTPYGASVPIVGDVIMFAVDFSGYPQPLYIGKNGTWFGTPGSSVAGNPTAGTGYVYVGIGAYQQPGYFFTDTGDSLQAYFNGTNYPPPEGYVTVDQSSGYEPPPPYNTYTRSIGEALSVSTHEVDLSYLLVLEHLSCSDSTIAIALQYIIERLAMTNPLSSRAIINNTVTDSIHTTSAVLISFKKVITENIILTPLSIITFSKIISEIIQQLDSLATRLVAHGTVAESIAIRDYFLNVYPRLISEAIAIGSTFISQLESYKVISDSTAITTSVTPKISAFFVVNEATVIAESLGTKGLLKGLISEGILFLPNITFQGEQYSGWALNSEIMAVSEYTNFNFNSLTKFNNKYYGCNNTGLFEITGVKDDGAFIPVKLETPAYDLGTSNIKQVPAMYLGVGYSGDLIVKISVDRNNTAYYKLSSSLRELQTQHIKLGKGLVGRYLQFEIAANGTDEFKLSEFEFFPIMFGRKL